MPAPAAPHKKGALTSSTTSRPTRAGTDAAASGAAARSRTAPSDEAELASRLEQVSLSRNAEPRTAVASTSRLQARSASQPKAPSAASKAISASRTSTPPATLEALFPSVNNTLARLSEARKAASHPCSASVTFVKAVREALPTVNASLAHLRSLCCSSDDPAELLPKTRLLAVERAAILFVSHCIDAGLLDAAVQQLAQIRQSLVSTYTEKCAADSTTDLAVRLQSLKLEARKPISRSMSATPASTKRASSSALSRAESIANLEETASLLSFPAFAEHWHSHFSAHEICTSVLIVQNQILSCLYGLSAQSASTTSRTSVARSAGKATPPAYQSVEQTFTVILSALETESGGPLGFFRAAIGHVSADERKKTEHYISTIYSLVMKRTSELATTETVTPLVTLKLQFYALECLLENQSYFALPESCENGKDDKSISSLANSLYRAVVSFGKTSTANGTSEDQLAAQISARILALLERMDAVIKPKQRLSTSKIYLEVMDLLVQLFDKGKLDTQLLRRHMEASPSELSSLALPKTFESIEPDQQDIEQQALKICTRLCSYVTELENWIGASYLASCPDVGVITEALAGAAEVCCIDPTRPSESRLLKARSSTIRSLERLHHYAYRAYKQINQDNVELPASKADIDTSAAILRELLATFCSLAETAQAAPELYRRAVDTLLLFARKEFHVTEPASYKAVHTYLQRSSKLSAKLTIQEEPRIAGTIASSAYSIGRSLYNNEKYANAVPFLRLSCLETVNLVNARQDSESQESLSDLLDKSASRWELLGSANAQCKEKQDALDSYTQCLVALFQQSAHREMVELQSDPAFMRVLAKYTKLCVLDLIFSPEDGSIANALSTSTPAAMSDKARGYLLEAQSTCLEGHMHKPEALQAVAYWLAQADTAFNACQSKPDVARIVLRRLFIAIQNADAGSRARIDELSMRITSLCNPTDGASWAARCSASAKLLCAVDLVRRRDPAASQTLAKQAKEALNMLRASLSLDSQSPPTLSDKSCTQNIVQPSSKVQVPVKPVRSQPGRRLDASRQGAALRKPLSPKTSTSQRCSNITTPPRTTKREADERAVVSGLHIDEASTTVDGLRASEETLALLDTIACMLGVFEHSFLRLGYLRFQKHLCSSRSEERLVGICLDLAYEYQQLGQQRRAAEMMAQAEEIASKSDLSLETRTLLVLRKAEQLAYMGCENESYDMYLRALSISERLALDEAPSAPRMRVLSRTNLLYRTAGVAATFATIAEKQGNMREAMSAAMQGLRLCNRAMSNLARLATPSDCVGNDPQSLKEMAPVSTASELTNTSMAPRGKFRPQTAQHTALGWRINQLLARCLANLAHLHQTRGTPKLAAYFYQQGSDLADSIGAPRLKAKVLAKQIDLAHSLHLEAEVLEKVALLQHTAATDGGLSTIEILRIKAQAAARRADYECAEQNFGTALASLKKLDKAFKDTENQFPSPERRVLQPGSGPSTQSSLVRKHESVLPSMHCTILQQYITMFNDSGQHDKMGGWLSQLADLSHGFTSSVEDSVLKAKLRLSEVFMDIRQDPVAGLLRDSVLSVPLLVSSTEQGSPDSKYHLPLALSEIELLLIGGAARYQMQASPPRWRDVTGAIAHLRVLQANMGSSDPVCSNGVTSALEGGVAVAARREMMEVLDSKLTHGILQDDLVWPHARPRLTNTKPLAAHWKNLESRYLSATSKGFSASSDIAASLPQNWSVLSLHVTPDEESLLAVRYDAGRRPLILQLPFDRTSRREGEDIIFSLQYARAEMSEIIESANATSQNAKNVTSLEDRREWWTERKALDRRLAALLLNIERRWLGAYKNVLTQSAAAMPTLTEVDDARKTQLLAVIEKTVASTGNNKAGQLQLDSALLDSFYSLPKDADDNDLEDWLHFIVDSLQFANVRIACDEIDLDQAVVDLRAILEERSDVGEQKPPVTTSPPHLFLVLDKGLHSFPWESLPSLAGTSISRLPALDFLKDRLDSRKHDSEQDSLYPGLCIDKKKTFYVLDPGNDLKHTQKEFHSLMQNAGWSGITARAPMEEEMRRGLGSAELFLYFGHGGAEQYIRAHVLRSLSACSTAFLWGCSSAYLKEQGDYEEHGTPLVYMQAGAPAVVGNLWDVTDKDLDRYTRSCLEKFGLFGEMTNTMPLPQAIAAAREACSLRYLNGAAPVVWGIPVSLKM